MSTHHPVMVGLVLLLSVSMASAQDTCKASRNINGMPGIPGKPGLLGTDGIDGPPAPHGEPGISWFAGGPGGRGEKGDTGSDGLPGKVGPPGELGVPGNRGERGAKGQKGEQGDLLSTRKSVFSNAKNTNSYPRKGLPIKFTRNVMDDQSYNPEYQVGKFTCTTAGLYYFVYHATSKGNLCVNIVKNAQIMVGFCDKTYNTFQVSSGAVVLKLKRGEKVWLQPTDSNSMLGMEGSESIFSGFLLFPD